MAIKITQYTVEGSFDFPIDMLRYDQSWPLHESESVLIENSINERHPVGRTTIKLSCIGQPEPDRWRSFGWQVIEINGKRVARS